MLNYMSELYVGIHAGLGFSLFLHPKFAYVKTFLYLCAGFMTYNEYIAQEQQAIDEEHSDDSCFLTDTPECQFVRGH